MKFCIAWNRNWISRPSVWDWVSGGPRVKMLDHAGVNTHEGSSAMKSLLIGSMGLFMAASAVAAEPGQVMPLMTKDLKEIAGKEAVLITVDYPPGASDLAHRHNAHVFVYVLEGSLIMQVKGGKQVTLGPGQTFYESPDDIHAVGRNASDTKPAKFIVFFVKEKETPLLSPAQ